jgi:eukaryotic-like serine/threonine-protein kinase
MTEIHLTGFDAVELLGYGSGGEVWLARERATGLPVALKRLRAGADLATRDRLRREAAVLAGVDHPHMVRLRSVHGDGDALVLVLDLAAGGSLARLLATRRRLAPGEVVTIAVPLAQALATVHAQGLVHGDVTPANVLFAADGRPLLSDLGVARLLGIGSGEVSGTRGYLDPAVLAGGAPAPASDVHGLAATCLAALTGQPPYDEQGNRLEPPDGTHVGLCAALEAALAPDPADRPTADALAVAVFDAVAAEPVRFDRRGIEPGEALVHRPVTGPVVAPPTHQVRTGPRAAEEPAEAASRRRGRWAVPRLRGRGAVAVACAGVALTLAAVTGIAWAGADEVPTAAGLGGSAPTRPSQPATTASAAAVQAPVVPPVPAPSVTSHPTDWASTLRALDQARSAAFARGDAAGLRAVYAPRAPALERDLQVLARLTRAGLRAEDLRLAATSITTADRSGDRVRLSVTDVMPPYRLVDTGGAVVAERPGRGVRSWSVVLARAGDRWLVYDVVRG